MNKNLLKETYATHKDGDLQMNIYETDYDIPYHWHDEYEFIYVSSGVCSCVINGEQIIINQGELMIIQSGELHTVNTDANAEFFAIVMHPYICGADCNKFFSPSVKFNRIFRRENITEKQIIENILKIYKIFKEKSYTRELKIKSLICDIFSILYDKKLFGQSSTTNKNNYNVFQTLIEYIHKNYATEITLAAMCSITHYSKPYIINLFKENTGKTPIDYINRYRIYKAQEILLSSDKNIIDISLECGFDNVGYFNRIFKRYLGTTPGRWRRL